MTLHYLRSGHVYWSRHSVQCSSHQDLVCGHEQVEHAEIINAMNINVKNLLKTLKAENHSVATQFHICFNFNFHSGSYCSYYSLFYGNNWQRYLGMHKTVYINACIIKPGKIKSFIF